MQSFIADCPSVSYTSDRCSDSSDYFFVCEIQDQAATSLHKTRLYVHLSLVIHASSKPLYLRFRMDTAADINVMPVSVYKNCIKTSS